MYKGCHKQLKYIASSEFLHVSVHSCIIQVGSVQTPTRVLKCVCMFVKADALGGTLT